MVYHRTFILWLTRLFVFNRNICTDTSATDSAFCNILIVSQSWGLSSNIFFRLLGAFFTLTRNLSAHTYTHAAPNVDTARTQSVPVLRGHREMSSVYTDNKWNTPSIYFVLTGYPLLYEDIENKIDFLTDTVVKKNRSNS